MATKAAKRWALNSQLLLAIKNNDVTGASKLFDEGLDTDTRFSINSEKLPAICLCVENNDINMVKLLIGLGAGVNQKDSNDRTALHTTCEHGYYLIAQLLLESRADVQCIDKNGQTPLHLAAKMGRADFMNLLISYGASLNKTDNLGRTPIHYASLVSHSHAVEALLEAGADARVIDKHGNSALHFAVDSLGTNVDGIVALCKAFPMASLRPNELYKTPLHILVGADRRGEEEALSVMLNEMPIETMVESPPVLLSPRSIRGHTPLHLAVLERKPALVRLLIASGAEVDTRDQLGRTPLECAVRDMDWNIVALLLAAGASVRRLISETGIMQVKDDTICDMVITSAMEPMKLNSLCRRTISRTWGARFQKNIELLPRNWRNFLSYKEL